MLNDILNQYFKLSKKLTSKGCAYFVAPSGIYSIETFSESKLALVPWPSHASNISKEVSRTSGIKSSANHCCITLVENFPDLEHVTVTYEQEARSSSSCFLTRGPKAEPPSFDRSCKQMKIFSPRNPALEAGIWAGSYMSGERHSHQWQVSQLPSLPSTPTFCSVTARTGSRSDRHSMPFPWIFFARWSSPWPELGIVERSLQSCCRPWLSCESK